jgi:hypothetical protein
MTREEQQKLVDGRLRRLEEQLDLRLPDAVAEGRLLWMRKVAKPEPRRWSSPDGKVVYEEVERFEDADYAGTWDGAVTRTGIFENTEEWFVMLTTVPDGSGLAWVRRVFGGER